MTLESECHFETSFDDEDIQKFFKWVAPTLQLWQRRRIKDAQDIQHVQECPIFYGHKSHAHTYKIGTSQQEKLVELELILRCDNYIEEC